jgi:hypothetical protein
MPPGEAFSRVKIDEQLRDVGWNLMDAHLIPPAQPTTSCKLVHRSKQMIHLIGLQSLTNYRICLNHLSELVH